MELTSLSAASIHETLSKITELYSGEEDQLVSTDFYFQPLREKGKLLVFNDDDEESSNITIDEWKEYPADTFYDEVTAQLTAIIEAFNTEGELERLAVWMPYSFVLVDDERESLAELLLVDEDTLLVTDSLLEGLDADLNAFIEKLLDE